MAYLCNWASYQVEVEALYLFNASIHETGWKQLDNKPPRTRQGLIPDFFINDDNYLVDIKAMSVCPSRYGADKFKNNKKHEAVRTRQKGVHAEYHRKASKIDREYNNHESTQSGPVSIRLAQFDRIRVFACGAFGEGSSDLHDLCAAIAKKAAVTKFQDMGARSTEEAYSRALRYVYRVIGMEMMKGAAMLKQRRIGVARGGSASAKQATARRQQAARKWACDRLAYFNTHSYGGTRRSL